MASSSFTCALYPDVHINLALYDSVTNCNELRQMAVNGKINAALIKPSMVLEPFQVLVAATKAYHLHKHNKKVTRSLNSEIIYSLSASKNISESFRNFGISDSDNAVLVVELTDGDSTSQMSETQSLIEGRIADVKVIRNQSEADKIKKVYKIKDTELNCGSITDAVVSRIASKDFVSFS